MTKIEAVEQLLIIASSTDDRLRRGFSVIDTAKCPKVALREVIQDTIDLLQDYKKAVEV
jgi:hypothetical protein